MNRSSLRARWCAGAVAASILFGSPTTATAAERPFGLPFADPPGPTTWLVGQGYGNTTGAFVRRREWYGAGQGIHFGIDFSAKCGTQVVSIGDGTVKYVDAMWHGAGPHNLLIDQSNGYVTLYGHLLEAPKLTPGQPIKRGQPIGLTGDPDLTCTSRPHLHLEIRDKTSAKAFNPSNLIDADWDALALTGSFGRGYQRNLDNPRQWQSIFDQPDIVFGGAMINEFPRTWPQDWR